MARRLLTNRLRYLMIIVLCAVVLLQPLRMTILSLVLPTTWMDTDTTHLYRVLHDFQNFEVDKEPLRKLDEVWSKVQVNMSTFDLFKAQREKSFPEFQSRYNFLKSQPLEVQRAKREMQVLDTFQPLMTPTEAAQLLFAFDTFVRACQEADLLFFILEASLMGVIRHHGMIPWDDDIDIVMSGRQWKKIRNVLGNIEGFELYAPGDSQWKFYMKSAKTFPDKPFKFPNLDIFFYEQDETHMWSLTKGLKHDLVYSLTDIFPLQLRPFEHLMVPVPCNLDLVVYKSHDTNVCITPEYIHKTNANFYYGGKTAVHCKELYHVYPFVFKAPSKQTGFEEEYLKVAAKVIQKKTVPTGCFHER